MHIGRARRIYFSPTHTTRKVLEGISEGLQLETVAAVDLTPPEMKEAPTAEISDELVLIGAPVYAGRIPAQAAERIRRFEGAAAPAVVVVLYGNRAYEDALLELRDIAAAAGFRPIAAAAFIGEHSFADDALPVAMGRPDASDLEKARAFGESIRSKLAAIDSLDAIETLPVPGNFPYKELRPKNPVSPVTDEALCTKCGRCAEVCPEAAIVVADTVVTEAAACIRCHACVKNCPSGARRMEDPRTREVARWLCENCAARKEPEVFI